MSENLTFKSASIKLTQKDAINVFMSIAIRAWKSKALVAILYLAVISYLLFIKKDNLISDVWMPIAFGLICLMTFVYIVDFIVVYFHSRKLVNSPLFSTEVEVRSNENGFFSVSDRGEQELRWSDFEKFQEIKKHIYLKTYEGVFLIFPKRSFDDENLNAFKKLAQENIKK